MRAKEYRDKVADSWTEKQFQEVVVKRARAHGWLVYHTFDSRRSEPGFPDLVLVRDRIVFRELKTNQGRLSPYQSRFLAALKAAGADVGVWRPSDLIAGDVDQCLWRRD